MHVLFGLSTFSTLSDPRMGSEVAAATMARYLARREKIKVTMVNILWTGFEPDQFDLVHLWNAGGHKGPYALAARLARAAGRVEQCFMGRDKLAFHSLYFSFFRAFAF